jgi:hypothetical protein
MIKNTIPTEAWEMTLDYRTFIETVLDAKVSLRPGAVYVLATEIMQDPLIEARNRALTQAWWATNPFADLDVSDEPDPNAPDIKVAFPNHYQMVAERLTKEERQMLRKKYGEK